MWGDLHRNQQNCWLWSDARVDICDLFYTNSMCMYVSVYACMCVFACVYVCMHLFVYMWRMCVRKFQLFQFQVAYRMINGMCVYDCVRVCVCVANGCTYMFDNLGSEGVNWQSSWKSMQVLCSKSFGRI